MRCLIIAAALMTALLAPISPIHAVTPDFKQPNAYAVVVGISQYSEEVIPKVTYAVKDAEAVARLLETQGGIPKTHIKLLTDAKATIGNFRNYLGEWLRMRVKPDSTVYVYYAGHGTPNLQDQSGSIVPWDGHPDFPAGLYPLKELEDTLSKLPTKDVVVFLDSCFSGAAGRSVLTKGARPMGLQYPVLAAGEVMILAAATGTQISSDYDKAEHGLFTHYLLTGLQGEADRDQDRLVTMREIFTYVQKHVAETAVEELNREQTPVLLPGEEMLGKRMAQPLVQVSDKPKREEPKPIQEARARPYETPRQPGQEIMGKDGAPMVLIPAGEFLYGETNQRLSLPAFYMDKYEVTTKLYAAFMQTTGRKGPYRWNEVSQVSDGERPVSGVGWNDADVYCRWAGKRLPTEQEWEKAARGTDGRKYPWGNEEPTRSLASYSWGNVRSWQGYSTLESVGSYEAGKSPYGIYDMAGNVWEWTKEQVIRGGSWFQDATYLRSTFRSGYSGSYLWYNLVGFRCVIG